MTGTELKYLRYAIGDYVYGNGLTVAEAAKLCGLSGPNSADKFRKWEDGEGPTGPVATLMEIFGIVADPRRDQVLRDAIAEIVDRRVQS